MIRLPKAAYDAARSNASRVGTPELAATGFVYDDGTFEAYGPAAALLRGDSPMTLVERFDDDTPTTIYRATAEDGIRAIQRLGDRLGAPVLIIHADDLIRAWESQPHDVPDRS